MPRWKVFGSMLWVSQNPPARSGDRTARCVVAATNQRAAAKAMGMSLHAFRQYAGESGNSGEVEVALAFPGIVFWQNRETGEWTPLKSRS